MTPLNKDIHQHGYCTQNQDLDQHDHDPIQHQHGCCTRCCDRDSCRFLKTSLVWFFTDWPWDIAKYISLPDTIPKDSSNDIAREEESKCSFKCLFIYSAVVIFRVSLILMAAIAQLMTCFRRDRIIANLTVIQVHHKNVSNLRCNETSEVIGGFIVSDTVIVLLAIWVYFGLKYGNQCCRDCGCRFGWKELNYVMEADSIASLSELIKAVREKLLEKRVLGTPAMVYIYAAIPFFYIVFSQGVSGIYLDVFHLVNNTVVIQPVGTAILRSALKDVVIAASCLGFIVLDLLYLQVIMRYAYRCQMIIYYLQIIIESAKNANEQKINYEDMMQKTETAHKFLKKLNISSGTIALVTIIAAFQAANCAFFLLSDDTKDSTGYFQAVAVILRLILWAFMVVFPFHKAAGVNIASKELRDLGWVAHKQPLVYHCNSDGSNNGVHISLKARVFGISVNPWLPYLVIILLLLTIMVGSKFKWYTDVLG